MPSMTNIERVTGTADTVPVNAYVIEGTDGVAVVDGTLTVSGGRALRARIEAIGKPLAGVLVTHAHPDHYGGQFALAVCRQETGHLSAALERYQVAQALAESDPRPAYNRP